MCSATSQANGCCLSAPIATMSRFVRTSRRSSTSLASSLGTPQSYAAVMGDRFDLDVLEAIPEIGESALDALEAAIAARLIAEDVEMTDSFRFSHVIARQAVLDSLTATRRAVAHGR